VAVPTAIRDELRVRLGNPTTTEVTDTQLDTMLTVALRKLSRYKPGEGYSTLATVAEQTHYTLPAEVVSVRRMYLPAAGPPDTTPLVDYPMDGTFEDELGGQSPSLNWPEVVDFNSRTVRNQKLYGGTWYMEAGQLVVSPTPTGVCELTYVFSKALEWSDIEANDSLLEDLFLYALYLGFGNLSTARKRVTSVSRIGQSTTFSSGTEESSQATTYLDEWNSRVATPRGGPSR